MSDLRIRVSCPDCADSCPDVEIDFEGVGQRVDCSESACYRYALVHADQKELSAGDNVLLAWDTGYSSEFDPDECQLVELVAAQ